MDEDLRRTNRTFRSIHEGALTGKDLGRILGLTDGVFAFAITLLVIQLVVPVCSPGTNCDERWLLGQLYDDRILFIAYVFTFFMIGSWWIRHHATFRYIERYDSALIWINLVFLLTIAVEPFILGIFAAYSSVEVSVVLFGAVQAAAGALLLTLWIHAARAHLLGPEGDPAVVRYQRLRGSVITLIFVASVGVAFISTTGATIVWGIAIAVSVMLRRM